MADFHNIRIADIYKETEDTSVITFDVPEEFKQWKVAVKQIPGGKFSTYVNEVLQTGDVLEVMPPSGAFGVECQPEKDKNYLFFAAGSGITPVLSMIKTHLAAEPNSTCKLFYVNKTAKSIIFKEAGLSKDLVHYELFVKGLSEEDIKRAERLAQQNVEGTEVTIVDGGKEFLFTMTKEFDNILDAALNSGADLPFACKGGVCSTCKCEVKEGEVEMKINYALDEKEVSQNLVLSCQAVPTTDKVVVDFDV